MADRRTVTLTLTTPVADQLADYCQQIDQPVSVFVRGLIQQELAKVARQSDPVVQGRIRQLLAPLLEHLEQSRQEHGYDDLDRYIAEVEHLDPAHLRRITGTAPAPAPWPFPVAGGA